MEAITDIIQCSICLETFTDPRILPCIHTFCLKCLQQTKLKKDKQQPKEKLHCPICRIEHAIPSKGAEGFQKNFFMHRLLEVTAITQPLNKSCDMCLESKERDEDEVSQADVYCIQCHKNICRRCSKQHKIIPELKQHQLIPLGTEITKNTIKTILHQNCPQHTSEQAKMYCSDCKEVICVVCFAENHKSHTCSGVEKVGSASRQELIEVVSQVDIRFNEQLKKNQQCTDEKTNFQKNVENIEQQIISRKNELVALIDNCAKSLLDELASIRQTRLKEFQTEMDENERQLVIIESFSAYCKQVEANANNVELCQVVPTLKRRAEEIKQTQRILCRQSPESIQVSFEKTSFEEISKTENAIGRLKLSKDKKFIWDAKDSIRSSGILNIPSAYSVCGATKLEKKLWVLCRNPNVIRIFRDQNPFEFQAEIELKQVAYPFMIESSEKSKCLYVIQHYNNGIWKITTDDHHVAQWLTNVGTGILSMTSEGHFLSISDYQNDELKIYDSNSQLICHFNLPRNLYCPQHIIRKPNGEFLISHSEKTTVGPWAISRLASDGQTVISRFIPKDKTEELNFPIHLALDSDNDRLIVADYLNDRVILLDSDSLNMIKILLTKEENGISRPHRLCYDGTKKQLIVVQSGSKVEIFEIVFKNN